MLLAILLSLNAQSPAADYLQRAHLTASTDTLDTFTSEAGGAIGAGHGAYIIRSAHPSIGAHWEIVDTWYDSTGRETARQSVRTAARGFMTELETVRATTDSASLLITPDHVTAWVVPAGSAPLLYDGAVSGDRYPPVVVASAIARTHARSGTTFRYQAYTLFGGSPLQTRLDSIRIVRRDTLHRGEKRLAVVVLQRSNGGEIWVDEATGTELLSRGRAGPGRCWWHIRRGITPPRER